MRLQWGSFAARCVFGLAPIGIVASVTLSAGGCSSTAKTASDGSGRDEFAGEVRETEIKHEACEPGGKSVKSFKADDPLSPAKAYVTHVFEGSKEICWLADLNGDGRVDVYTYFGDDGLIRRREAAYSIEKAIDEIALYKGGNLDVVMRDTSFDGRLDTWDYYEGGKLVRRERDKTGEGRVDEWWTFQPGTDNVVIIQADPRTGKPDPSQKLEINVGFVAAPPPGAPQAPTSSNPTKSDAGPPPVPSASSTTMASDAGPMPTPLGSGSTTDAGKKDAK